MIFTAVSESQSSRKKLIPKDRDLSLETLRGIAILLVVMLHSVNSDAGDSYHYFTFSFAYLMMPLFTAISGYVYAFRPVQPDNWKNFLVIKTQRILLPLISVSTVQYFVSALLAGHSISGWWKIYIFGYAQFWFLQSLALVFLTIAALERFRALNSLNVMLMLIVLTSLVRIFVPELNIEALDGFLYILPYFLWGCSLRRFSAQLQNRVVILMMTGTAVVGIFMQHLAKGGIFEIRLDTNGPLASVVGLALVYIFFRWRRNVTPLSFLGKYSYSIYLFHAFGVSAGERLTRLISPLYSYSYWPQFVMKILCGVVFAICAEKVLSKMSLTQFVFLGIKPKRHHPEIDSAVSEGK
ncbi:MAG: acyltransferase [Deltaproteobacteria bacterium]|nr:acyltransferase [Deltaproteobacteria bacterium]